MEEFNEEEEFSGSQVVALLLCAPPPSLMDCVVLISSEVHFCFWPALQQRDRCCCVVLVAPLVPHPQHPILASDTE